MPHCNKHMLSFFLTAKCNLCCLYCYNANERNKLTEQSLSFEIAKSGIDWYFANNNCRHIRFYGPGEPTQEFELMRKITHYAKHHINDGERVTVEIQTNGVFSKEVREWILNNINTAWLSFDGMREIQEYYRPLNPCYTDIFNQKTSTDIIEDNIYWLNSNKTSQSLLIGARVTITEKNVCKQKEMVDYFYDLGIHQIWTDPLFSSVGNLPVCMSSKKSPHIDLNTYVDNYIAAYKYAQKKGVFWGSFLCINFDGESPYHCRSCTPLSAPHITTDGFLSACDMVLTGNEDNHMKCFLFGKWNEFTKSFDLYQDRISALNNRKSTNMKHCLSCPVQLHCGGYCLGEIVNETGALDGKNSNICETIRKLYSEIGQNYTYDYLHP